MIDLYKSITKYKTVGKIYYMQWLILVQGYISSKSKETKFFISVLKLITLEDFYA